MPLTCGRLHHSALGVAWEQTGAMVRGILLHPCYEGVQFRGLTDEDRDIQSVNSKPDTQMCRAPPLVSEEVGLVAGMQGRGPHGVGLRPSATAIWGRLPEIFGPQFCPL